MTKVTETTENTEATENKVFSRDEMRAKIFGAKPATETATLYGVPVELRAPLIGALIDESMLELDAKERMAHTLIRSVFVPGTDTPVFEDADVENLVNLPAGGDLSNLQRKLQIMLGVNLEDATKRIEEQ